MRVHIPGAYLTVFLLFFGIALLDAMRMREWLAATLWVAFGLLFAWADMRTRFSGPVVAKHTPRVRS